MLANTDMVNGCLSEPNSQLQDIISPLRLLTRGLINLGMSEYFMYKGGQAIGKLLVVTNGLPTISELPEGLTLADVKDCGDNTKLIELPTDAFSLSSINTARNEGELPILPEEFLVQEFNGVPFSELLVISPLTRTIYFLGEKK